MADEYGNAVTGGGEDDFQDLDLEGMAYVIAADLQKVPTWRKQAQGYRKLARLGEQLRGDLSGHIKNALNSWSSKGAVVVENEAAKMDDSFQRGLASVTGNAEALERIADEVEDAHKEVSRLQAEWAEMKARYQKNPHLFDGYAADGVSGYQAAKASYDQSARERMHAMSVVASQAWYTNMHKPGEYTGPVSGQEPIYPVRPSDGSGSGGGRDTTYPFLPPPPPATSPGAGAPGFNGHEPVAPPALPPAQPNDPRLEFPTPVHTPGPSVITAPGPLPGGGPVMPSGGGFPTSTPPVSPSMFNPMRPSAQGGVPGPRTSPSVLGQRAAQPGARGATAGRPQAVSAEKGVIRNPRQANGSAAPQQARPGRRRDSDDAFRDGPETDELFEGLALDAVPDVVRPEPAPPRVRRRDVGPVLRRKLTK